MSRTAYPARKFRSSGAKKAADRPSLRSSAMRRPKFERRLPLRRTPRSRASRIVRIRRIQTMAYIFHEDELPKLVSAVPGRERTFFVNKELTHIDDMLAGIMRYKQGDASAL